MFFKLANPSALVLTLLTVCVLATF